jgi:hypothetical protein
MYVLCRDSVTFLSKVSPLWFKKINFETSYCILFHNQTLWTLKSSNVSYQKCRPKHFNNMNEILHIASNLCSENCSESCFSVSNTSLVYSQQLAFCWHLNICATLPSLRRCYIKNMFIFKAFLASVLLSNYFSHEWIITGPNSDGLQMFNWTISNIHFSWNKHWWGF